MSSFPPHPCAYGPHPSPDVRDELACIVCGRTAHIRAVRLAFGPDPGEFVTPMGRVVLQAAGLLPAPGR